MRKFLILYSLLLVFFFFPLNPLLDLSCALEITDSEQDYRDAILERIPFVNENLNLLDANQDGIVDVADVILSIGTPITGSYASFFLPMNIIGEGIGEAPIGISLSPSLSGSLAISVSGTATPEVDYISQNSVLHVNGTEAELPISIINDGNVEDMEAVVVSFMPDSSTPSAYNIGVPSQHILWIDDNDAVWETVLEVENLHIGFEMTLIHDGNYSAWIESDGKKGLPQGTWPVELSITADRFYALIGPIPIDSDDTLLQTDFERKIVLESIPSNNPEHVLDLSSEVSGRMSDRLIPTSEGRQYLERIMEGSFTMVKDPALVPMLPSELIDS